MMCAWPHLKGDSVSSQSSSGSRYDDTSDLNSTLISSLYQFLVITELVSKLYCLVSLRICIYHGVSCLSYCQKRNQQQTSVLRTCWCSGDVTGGRVSSKAFLTHRPNLIPRAHPDFAGIQTKSQAYLLLLLKIKLCVIVFEIRPL